MWYLCGICMLNDGNFHYFESHNAYSEEQALDKFKSSVTQVYELEKFPSYFTPVVLAKSNKEIEVKYSPY